MQREELYREKNTFVKYIPTGYLGERKPQASKYITKCSNSLVIKEIQIKKIYDLIPGNKQPDNFQVLARMWEYGNPQEMLMGKTTEVFPADNQLQHTQIKNP